MKCINNSWFKISLLALVTLFVFAGCNKDLPQAKPIEPPVPPGNSLLEILDGPNYTLLKAAVTKASTFNSPTGKISTLLGNKNAEFTFFAPDDDAFIGSNIDAVTIAALRAGFLDTVLKYHLVGGQKIGSASIPTNTFPNSLYLQSMLQLAPASTSLPTGLRMPIFPGKAGPAIFVNNIPVIQADIAAANGTIHKVARVIPPPSQFLWQRIAADPDLTYLKAAINRADSGAAAPNRLQDILLNPAANLTFFAPNNAAMQTILTGLITLELISQGMDPVTAATVAADLADAPDVFSNPLLFPVLTPTFVKGIIVYHILGVRSFSVNIPGAATLVKTLLNNAIPAHPGVTIQATFGAAGVTAATVKGLGNTTESNILINPTPAPGGSSDQHYINGVLHVIDQVLLLQ